jgi:AraC-like DNA-binding protein
MRLQSPSTSSLTVNGFVVSDIDYRLQRCSLEHDHEWPFIAVVLSGGIEKALGRLTFQVPPAGAYVMPAEVRHRDGFPVNARILALEIDPQSAIGLQCAQLMTRIRRLRDPSLGTIARQLAVELRGADDGAKAVAVEGLALELVAAALRSVERASELPRPPAWLAAIDDHLAENYLGRIRVDELGALVHVHPAHLARVYRAHHGESIGRHVRRLRLDWAKSQLLETDQPLAEIAVGAGFSHQSHFTRVFKQATGWSPAQFRARQRALA